MALIPAVIDFIEQRTDDIAVIRLMPQQAFAFDAGQYLDVVVPGQDSRKFSIASAPAGDNAITLHVRDLGRGVSHFLTREAKPGDAIQIQGPYGRMHARSAMGRPVFMVGGGTGVVPLLAIAEDIVRKGHTEDGITLLYGVRMEADIHCARELDILKASGELGVHMAVGAETPDKVLARLNPKLDNHAVFISGPDPMLWGVLPILKKLGARDELLFTDADLDVLAGRVS